MSKIVQLANKLTVVKDLGPERDYTERGRLRKVFSTMSEHKLGMLLVNLVTALFAAPLIVMFLVLMGMYESSQIAGLNFSGFIGIGYGLTDDTVSGINIIYDIRQDFFLYFFTPCLMILSIGLAGAYHCIRNWMWGVEVKPKHYFRGIKLHWWKFLSAFTFMGLVGVNAAWSTIELMRLTSTVGSAGAGIWVWCISALLIALLTVLFMGVWLPMSVMFKTGYGASIKNAVICFLIFALNIIIATVLMALPLCLIAVDILNYLIYAMMLFYGGAFMMTCNVSLGMWVGDMSLNTLYEYERKQSEQQPSRKGNKKQRKNGKGGAPAAAANDSAETERAEQTDGVASQPENRPAQPKPGQGGGKNGGKRRQYRRR